MSGYFERFSLLGGRCLQQVMNAPKGRQGRGCAEASAALARGENHRRPGPDGQMGGFRYGPVNDALWKSLGQAYLVAESLKSAQKPVQLYPNMPGSTTVTAEYLHALAFNASSMDSLMPLEIELADRLIGHYISGFDFSADPKPSSVYWVDAALAQGPKRMAKLPQVVTPTLRFFSPGSVPQAIADTIRLVERGDLPDSLNLGGRYLPRTVLPVLRHLALYWAAQPPLRGARPS